METIRKRLVWTMAILVFFFLLAAARTGYVQLVQGYHYARKAMAGSMEGVPLEDFPRGRILDRKGRVLTGEHKVNRVLVFPEILEDPAAAARDICEITGLDSSGVRGLFSGRKPFILPCKITLSQASKIRDLGCKGVLVVPFSLRYGPRPLAGHITGHLGKISNADELGSLNRNGEKQYRMGDWVGRQGLEYFYEKELKGLYPYGYAGLYTDALGSVLPGMPVTVDTRMGDVTRCDVATTIDADIQYLVESVMDRHVKKGAVVVMESSTGNILAAASRPAYNPDPEAGGLLSPSGDGRFVNQALSLFQPGSTFKVVVAAAALSEGFAVPETRFFCRGARDMPIRCWNENGHGSITLAEAFSESCNPVFARLGMSLGPQRIISQARAMGLDSQAVTGYPVPRDRRQDLSLIAGKYNLANSSVGQGPVLVTPVQVTAAVNAVANGGIYLQPRLVEEVRPAGKPPLKIEGPGPSRAMSPEVALRLREMMTMVTRQGAGKKAWLDQGGTAGKTGSAQTGDGSGTVNAWFSGYGPLARPRYTITILVREGVSGGDSAAPVFKEIMEKLYYMEMD